ncbi:MAG: aldehyde dehydrogenase family protein, partial [Paracoccaceae bacterium]
MATAISEHLGEFYIDGAWVKPSKEATSMGVENPATEEIVADVALGSEGDADRAIMAAREAFDGFNTTPPAERIALLKRIHEVYLSREDDFTEAFTTEMGAPLEFSRGAQFWAGDVHIGATITSGEKFEWEHQRDQSRVVYEGIGVAGMITPWNWPVNQIACKVAPAIVAGCAMVLKPSEIAPLSGALWAEVMHEAGTPKGVFNLVNGTGPTVGARLSSHPQVDMVSFTGSTRAGIQVAINAAPTVKRVAQE